MAEWEKHQLLELAVDFGMGPFGSNIKAENFVDSGVPVIRGTNLNFYRFVDGDFVFLTEEKATSLRKSNCLPGDLVFTHRGTIGQVGLIPEGKYPRYIISQSGMKMTPDSSKLDKNYLFYFFKSPIGQFELLQHESQVGVPSISRPLSALKSIEVPVPPLPEQKAIASVLSSLDDKIDLLHRQNTTLEAMAETLFRQWFVEEAQDDWEEGYLGDVIELNYGKALQTSLRSGSGYPVVGSSGIMDFHSDYLVEAPGIVIGRKGTLGRVIYLSEPFYPIDTTYYVKSKLGEQDLIFEYFLLKSINFIDMNSDSAVPGLNRNIALGVEICIPPEERIQQFRKFTKPIFVKSHQNQGQIQKLEQLRDTLLPKLMSGKVRVNYE